MITFHKQTTITTTHTHNCMREMNRHGMEKNNITTQLRLCNLNRFFSIII